MRVPLDCFFSFQFGTDTCPLCGHVPEVLSSEEIDESEATNYWNGFFRLYHCDFCSWWSLDYRGSLLVSPEEAYSTSCSLSVQKELPIGDKAIPLGSLHDYLKAHSEEIDRIHPRRLEELLAAIFAEHGFRPMLTTYSKDGGIDIILFEHDGHPTAVQVKRYRETAVWASMRFISSWGQCSSMDIGRESLSQPVPSPKVRVG
jgi:restriction endonuclease